MYCRKCNMLVSSDTKYCGNCGNELIGDHITCPHCDNKTWITDRFCGFCGRPIQDISKQARKLKEVV